MRELRAGHHLFWVQDPKTIRYYRHGPSSSDLPISQGLDIFCLMERFSHLRTALDLWVRGRPYDASLGEPDARRIRALLNKTKEGESVDLIESRKMLNLLFKIGSGEFFRAARELEPAFRQSLTPTYLQVLKKIDLSLPRQHELMFQTCLPDFYLWLPPECRQPEKAIVCFTTRDYTLNISLPLAHSALARLGVPLLYVRLSQNTHPAEGIAKIGLSASTELIKWIMRRFEINQTFALGTSIGGYAACLYTPALNFERILNFSGTLGKASPGNEIWNIDLAYDRSRIMTIFSELDTADLKLLAAYREHGFESRYDFVRTETHGTFIASLLEDKLDTQLSWLTNGT